MLWICLNHGSWLAEDLKASIDPGEELMRQSPFWSEPSALMSKYTIAAMSEKMPHQWQPSMDHCDFLSPLTVSCASISQFGLVRCGPMLAYFDGGSPPPLGSMTPYSPIMI